MKTMNNYKQELQDMKEKAEELKYRFKYFGDLLKINLKKEVKVSLGYSFLQLCCLILCVTGVLGLTKSYYDYRIEAEKIIREKTIECQIYERYFDMEDNKIDTLRIYNY